MTKSVNASKSDINRPKVGLNLTIPHRRRAMKREDGRRNIPGMNP